MDKQYYIIMVEQNDTSRLERLLNTHRVSLNDWDRTEAFPYCGRQCVNYHIMCESDTYESIMKLIG